MRKTKTFDKRTGHAVESPDHDPFLQRIRLQGTVLKKMLAEVDQLSKSEITIINIEEESLGFLESENKSA